MKGKGCTERIAIEFATTEVEAKEKAKILEIAGEYEVYPHELVHSLKVSKAKAIKMLDKLVEEGYLERSVQVTLHTKDGKTSKEVERDYRTTEKGRAEMRHNLWQSLSMAEQMVMVHFARGKVPYHGYQQRDLAKGAMMPLKEVRKGLEGLMDKALITHKKSGYYTPSGYRLCYEGKSLAAFVSKHILNQKA